VPKDDPVIENPETVLLKLMLPPTMTPLPPPYSIGYPASAGAVIVDSNRPRPRLACC